MDMKSVMIVCNMILSDEVMELLRRLNMRGFTRWDDVKGRGTDDGEPHLGTHIWPGLNSAFLVIVPEERVSTLLDGVREIEKTGSQQGIKAFVWNIEQVV